MNEVCKASVLLVEDDHLVRMAVALALEQEGFEVSEAADAKQALSMLRDGLNPPVMVTDVDLGVGLSGAELADVVHETLPDLGVIFITGRPGSLGRRVMGRRETVLRKPFTTPALARLVQLMVG